MATNIDFLGRAGTEELVATVKILISDKVSETDLASYINNAVAQKSQVQIITWEADD